MEWLRQLITLGVAPGHIVLAGAVACNVALALGASPRAVAGAMALLTLAGALV
ncbi:MAG: hypothetical protein ACU0DW_08510 [Shimia sp.]